MQRDFHFVACDYCGFVAIADRSTDYATLYNEQYYRGEGADPMVDYANEIDHPNETVRAYEWRGIVDVLNDRVGNLSAKRWLDYGCGAGSLVRYANQTAGANCVGFDTGGFADRARASGIPILWEADLAALSGQFDIITLIEVIEHITDPVPFLKSVAALLAPGGTLFLTTGNAEPQLKSFLKWAYVLPEIHVSYFTPRSLEILYQNVGLTPVPGGYGPGWSDIIRFKILKNLYVGKRSVLEAMLP